MKKFWYAVLIIAVIYLGWEFFRPRAGVMQSQTSTAGRVTANALDSVEVFGPAAVTYSAIGFSPKDAVVKKGAAVIWTNISGEGMWVAVDEHPAHAGYDGTLRTAHCAEGAMASFDQCAVSAAGSQWSFTFNKVGTWKYHNHVNDKFVGTVTVTE